jgi:hypothetical protein
MELIIYAGYVDDLYLMLVTVNIGIGWFSAGVLIFCICLVFLL